LIGKAALPQAKTVFPGAMNRIRAQNRGHNATEEILFPPVIVRGVNFIASAKSLSAACANVNFELTQFRHI
jgi:hypothetical protein